MGGGGGGVGVLSDIAEMCGENKVGLVSIGKN